MPANRYASIQNPRQYRALRKRGYSKEAAARISNAQTPGTTVKAFDESKVNRDEGGQFSDGGGGGGSEKKPAPKAKPKKKPATPKPDAAENRSTVGDVLNANDDERLGKNGLEALNAFGDGKPLTETMRAGMEKAGLVRTDADGVTSLTAEGRRVLRAANKGDADAVGAALDDAGKRAAGRQARQSARDAKRQAAEAKRQAAEAKKKPVAAAKPEKPKKGGGGGGQKPDDQGAAALAAREAILRRLGRLTGATKAMRPARRKLWRAAYAEAKATGHDAPTARGVAKRALREASAQRARRQYERATLAIYKDARGTDRWLSISSTAYRDRDGEIVSSAALKQAVALADTTERRGPLRFWHVPGLDIGDCDYQAVAADGRFLIESGTFRKPAYAAALKAARPLAVSIGFTHPATEPDRAGVFHTIDIFERSLVPQGRASNPFTRITTKERTMSLPPEKLAALKALFGDAIAAGLVADVQQTDKAAQAAGVAFKADDAPAEIVINGVTYTVKAPMPPEQMAEAAMTEAADAAAEMAEGEAEMPEPVDEEADLVDLTVAEFRALMVEALESVIGGISGKMADMKAQYEAMGKAFGAMQATKDDATQAAASELAALKESRDALATQVAALDNRLKELEGDQPTLRPFRASEDASTVTAPPAAMKQASANPAENAYRAMFGNLPDFPIN